MKRLIKGLLWLAGIAALLYFGGKYFFASNDAPSYLTEYVKWRDIEVTILADGKLEASQQVDVGAQVSGKIINLHVALGDIVKKDQLIAEIDDLPQQNKLKDSEARLKNALASQAAKQAQIINAKITLDRQERLIAQRATTQSDYDVAVANLKVYQAELEALDALIAQAQIALDSAELDLGYTKILAPIDGVIVATVVKEGQTVNAVQSAPTIVKIANLDVMTIKAQISEADITKVIPGMPSYFTILGDPDKRYPATVRQLEPAPESFQVATTNTVTTTNEAIYYNGIFHVENPLGIFRVDMTAQVYIVTDSIKDKMSISAMATRFKPGDESLIPKDYLKENEAYVWVLVNKAILKPKKVVVGISDGIHTEILSGLEGTEEIVLSERLAGEFQPQQMRRPH